MVFEFMSLAALSKGIKRKREDDPGLKFWPPQIKWLEKREAAEGTDNQWTESRKQAEMSSEESTLRRRPGDSDGKHPTVFRLRS